MKVKITFINPVLGTLAGNPETAKEFILSKKPDSDLAKDELESLPEDDELLEKRSTIFPKVDGKPFLWDYQLKGFFKTACLAMILSEKFTQEELKKHNLTKYSHKRTIDLLVFCKPRQIFFTIPKRKKISFCERPLRGETMRGERISLARSEMLPAGTSFEADILLENPKLEKFIKIWLDYGSKHGMLQWRNSGMGSFEYKVIK